MFDVQPEEWRTTTLKSAAGELFTDGDWVESKDQDPNGEVRLIQLADIGDGEFLNKSARFLTAKKARELRCTFLHPGDLLIARMADPIARCCLFPSLDQPAATVVDVTIVRPSAEVDRDYLRYAVSSQAFRLEALGAASGTTRSRISRSNLGGIKLPLPPIEEQRRIAEVLRSAEQACNTSRAVIRQLGRVAECLVEDFLSSEGSISVLAPIGEMATYVGSGVTPKGGKQSYLSAGIPLIRSQNVHFDGLRREGLAFIDAQTDAKMARTRVQPDDVLLNITGASIGRCTLVPSDFGPANVNQHVCIIRTDRSKALPSYLSIFLSSYDGQRQIDQLQGGLSREGLNFQQVRAIQAPLPPIHIQAQFSECIASVRSASIAASMDLGAKEMVKRGLMDELLFGRVRVPA